MDKVRPGGIIAVYPRVCGGTADTETERPRLKGLSPRVRGNRIRNGVWQPGGGSIPACAGEPMSRLSRQIRKRVYPRVCGGTDAMARSGFQAGGLSPRVRGNRL